MIEIKINNKLIDNANRKAKELGHLNNSIRCGEGIFIGFLGEELVKQHLGLTDSNTYDFDLIYKNKKLEVKTKERTVQPKSFYNATVAAYNPNQKCDAYVFTSILKNLSVGWICGFIDKAEFYAKATFNRKGDPETPLFKFKADCYNLTYDKLHMI